MNNSETCHFWAGHYPSSEKFCSLFVETYDREDDQAISEFASSQDQISYDHDFLEYGFSDTAKTIAELVQGYSYSDQWLAEFETKVSELGLSKVNAFVFITDEEIDAPRSIDNGKKQYLHYLGKISFKI